MENLYKVEQHLILYGWNVFFEKLVKNQIAKIVEVACN